MKQLIFVVLFVLFSIPNFAQFADTSQLNQFIRDTIQDRRPNKITAAQIQKAFLGITQFLGYGGITGANQGLIASGNNIQLGQLYGSGNSALINTLREIPVDPAGGIAITGRGTGMSNTLSFHQPGALTLYGQLDSGRESNIVLADVANGMTMQWSPQNDSSYQFSLNSSFSCPSLAKINFFAKTGNISIGDLPGVGPTDSNSKLTVFGTAKVLDTFKTPNIIQNNYDTNRYKIDVVDSSGNHFKSSWPALYNDIQRMPYTTTYVPAIGLKASDTVTNYSAKNLDSVDYKISTTAYATTGKYGAWLTPNLSGDSIQVTSPFIVAIGNSITEGHPLYNGRLGPPINLAVIDSCCSFEYFLGQKTHMRVFNHGIGGQTTAQIWARWNRDVLAQTVGGVTTLTRKPYIVIVESGINDVFAGESAATIEENLLLMAQSAAANGIYCVMFTLPGDEAGMTVAYSNVIDQVNRWLKSGILNPFGTVVYDFNSFWRDTHTSPPATAYNDNAHGNAYLADDIHFTPVGYDSLAEDLFRTVHMPQLKYAVINTQLSPAGFSGYSRPNSLTIDGTTYTYTPTGYDTIMLNQLFRLDTIWVRINSSVNVTGTSYTGISAIRWIFQNDTTENVYTRKSLVTDGYYALYPYVTINDPLTGNVSVNTVNNPAMYPNGTVGIQTPNPQSAVEVDQAISRSETSQGIGDIRTYTNLAFSTTASHTGQGGFYMYFPDGSDAAFFMMEIDVFTASYNGAWGKIFIGGGNHQMMVQYDGACSITRPAVRFCQGGTLGLGGVLMIGDSTFGNWDWGTVRIGKLTVWAGFRPYYNGYDTMQVRFSHTPITFFNNLMAGGSITYGSQQFIAATGNLYTQTSGVTVTNTTAATNIIGTGRGSSNINPSVYPVLGSTITIRGTGLLSTASTAPNITLTLGTASYNYSSGAFAAPASLSNAHVEWELRITTTGTSGGDYTGVAEGWVSINGTKQYFSTSSIIYQSSLNQIFSLNWTFSAASSNNTFVGKILTIKIE